MIETSIFVEYKCFVNKSKYIYKYSTYISNIFQNKVRRCSSYNELTSSFPTNTNVWLKVTRNACMWQDCNIRLCLTVLSSNTVHTLNTTIILAQYVRNKLHIQSVKRYLTSNHMLNKMLKKSYLDVYLTKRKQLINVQSYEKKTNQQQI